MYEAHQCDDRGSELQLDTQIFWLRSEKIPSVPVSRRKARRNPEYLSEDA